MAKRKFSDHRQTTGDCDDDSEYDEFVHKRPKKAQRRKSTARITKDDRPDLNTYVEDSGHLSKDQEQHPLSRHVIDSTTLICSALLDWYAGVRESRGMPWRKPYDPSLGPDGRAQRAYEVWISEIMLQQTQVATVIPYYNRWMEKFPTIKALAASDIETVNGLWKGLGYYSRAARLLSGAQQVIKKLGGRLPDNAKDMKDKIPGIGRYSAGAICSIAYNQRVPVLDGNVHRLLSRFLALHAPPKTKATLDILWSAATTLVEGTDHPGDLNQSLIELGSVLCKPREPACAACPVQSWCKAYQSSLAKDLKTTPSQAFEIPDIEEICTVCDPLPDGVPVTAFPMKTERKKAREELDVANVVEWRCGETGNRWFLLVRRPDDGLLAGLYEFPTLPNVSPTATSSDLTKIPHSLLSTLLLTPPQTCPSTKRELDNPSNSIADSDVDNCVRITKIESAGDVLHMFSHIKKTYRLQWVVMEGGVHPPMLRPALGLQPGETRNSGKAKAATKSKMKANGQDDSSPVSSRLMWIPIQEVTNANVGTGVLKIWDQVKSLWQANS